MKNGWYDNYGALKHYVNNKYHNEKYPSIISDKGTKVWYQNNYPHRIDGPAIELNNGKKYWYYQGKEMDCNSQKEFERYLKLKILW